MRFCGSCWIETEDAECLICPVCGGIIVEQINIGD